MKTAEHRSNRCAGSWRLGPAGLSAMAVVLLMAVTVLVGCGSSPDVVNDTKIRDLSHPQLLALLQGGHDADRMVPADGGADGGAEAADAYATSAVRLVDVRAPRHFEQGRLPGAINIFLPDLRGSDARLKGAESLVVYAQTWQDSLGPAAAKRLIALGYDEVYLYRGGVELWIARGGQLEGGE